MKKQQQIAKLKEFWINRNPVHENNSDTGEDMFWETVLCVFEDMNRVNAVKSDNNNRTFIVTIECGEITEDLNITAPNELAAKITAASNYAGKKHNVLRFIEHRC